jgi:hypothetical protein
VLASAAVPTRTFAFAPKSRSRISKAIPETKFILASRQNPHASRARSPERMPLGRTIRSSKRVKEAWRFHAPRGLLDPTAAETGVERGETAAAATYEFESLAVASRPLQPAFLLS